MSLWITFPTGCPFLFVSSKRKKKKKGRTTGFSILASVHLSLRSIKLHKEQGNSPTKLTIDSPFPPIRVLHWIKVSRTIRKRERGTSGKQRVDASRVESFNVSWSLTARRRLHRAAVNWPAGPPSRERFAFKLAAWQAGRKKGHGGINVGRIPFRKLSHASLTFRSMVSHEF